MAEQEIKRLNYFTGQFLKEQEFKDEQKYHIHMRQRINYILFETSGVISVNPDDLTFDINNTENTFKVKEGMAVCINHSEKEAKEIILREESETFSLNENEKIWVTLQYNEVNTETSSEGGVQGDTRTLENAVVRTHTDGNPDPGEDYVILGAIESSSASWQANYDDRQEAKIRASLIGAAPVTPVPTITDINVVGPIVPDRTVEMTITGTNLGNNPVVTILDNYDNLDNEIDSSNITIPSNTQLVVDLVIGEDAAPGGRKVRVETDDGPATTDPDAFVVATVTPAVATPVITGFTPQRGRPGRPVTITGRNFTGAVVTFDGKEAVILSGSSDIRINTEVPDVAPNSEGKLRVSRGDNNFAEVNFIILE